MAQYRKDTYQYLPDGKTIFEVVMLADQYGNPIGAANPAGMAVDSFGRARISSPLTLFDSFHRYKENSKFNTANTSTATYTFNSSTSSVDCTVDTTSGASVKRESKRVFAYQPGKALQVLNSFVMNPAKANLRQRVGFFSTDNGVFLERNGVSEISFVKRSKVTGSVVDTPVAQTDWNIDKLDGTGPSGLTLNLNYPQILFIDIEWLGVGSIRMGFFVNGKPIHCHTFHHSNLSSSPLGAYMQTACLPIRAEIENTGTTASSSTLKTICSTVVSEGGYELAGSPRTISTGVTSGTQRRLDVAGTYYPVISLRLHPDTLDAVCVLKSLTIIGVTSASYKYKLVAGATVAGEDWANTYSDSSIQYNVNAAATMSGGTDLFSGLFSSTNQGTGITQLDPGLFTYQFERNSFTGSPITLTLAVTSGTATSNVVAEASWQEIT